MGVLISNKHAASLSEAKGKFHKDEPGTEYSKGEIVIVNSSEEPGIAIKDGQGNVVLIGKGTGGNGKIDLADDSLEYVTVINENMRVKTGYRVKNVDCGEYK